MIFLTGFYDGHAICFGCKRSFRVHEMLRPCSETNYVVFPVCSTDCGFRSFGSSRPEDIGLCLITTSDEAEAEGLKVAGNDM